MKKIRRASRPSKKQVVLLGVILGLLLVGSATLYMYVSGIARSSSEELAARQQELQESERLSAKLADTQEAYIRTASQLKHLEQSVATEAYVPTLLEQIEVLATSCGCVMQSIRPAQGAGTGLQNKPSSSSDEASGESKPEAAPEPKLDKKVAGVAYDTLDIAVEVEGPYWNLTDFLQGLTSFKKIVAVNNIQLTPVGGSEKRGSRQRLTLKLDLTAYILKEGGSSSGRS